MAAAAAEPGSRVPSQTAVTIIRSICGIVVISAAFSAYLRRSRRDATRDARTEMASGLSGAGAGPGGRGIPPTDRETPLCHRLFHRSRQELGTPAPGFGIAPGGNELIGGQKAT